jgi:homogentisate phytyltransferase/homogentisate geranylgeranyltransferase
MKAIITLWKFSRPHTIIGSVIGISTLFCMIYDKHNNFSLSYFLMALLIAITCNVFIVGINQVADVNIDKINKPYLPIPAGVLCVRQAKIIVYCSLFISLGLALFVSPFLFVVIAIATFIGWAYSMPPFYLKQHHISAAFAIAIVRGVLLNAGGFLVFNYLINNSLEMPLNLKILTLFVIVFSIVISWFKDLPDIEGDAKYNIKTFAILYSPKMALLLGNLMVGFAYVGTIYIKWLDYDSTENPSFETKALLVGHLILLGLFIVNAFSIRLTEHHSIKKFYMRFWWFFFAEYALYIFAYTAKIYSL